MGMKKKVLSATLCAVMVGSLAAPAFTVQAADDTLVYWSMWEATEPQGQVIQEAVDAYTEQTGVKVDLQFKGRTGNREALQPALDGGTQIDIFDEDIDRVNGMYGKYLLDLEDLAKDNDYEATANAGLMAACRDAGGGTLKTIPYQPNVFAFFYNKDLFEENGWKVPTTWQEFTTLRDEIKQSGTLPLYLGFKDTWTCLAPWNALAVGLTDSDTCNQVNMGNTTFSDTYGPVAEKMRALLDYAEKNPYAYGYNDACTAFARGESAMYPIGSYAIPQIKSVNPDMNIGSFTFPANDEESDNVLNSGIDLQFSVMKACKNKEAAYEVLKYLYDDETIQIYLDDQGGIACKDGDFAIPDTLKDMQEYIKDNRMSDYQDHHYPSEMSVDAMIQTYLLDTGDNAKEKFLKKFDSDWKRYNRDLIREVQDYQKEQEDAK